ncbi:MAG: TIGR01777 family oxidoreductase [Bacteroidota bacterium]
MVIAISGAGGFIGKQLSAHFQSRGDIVRFIPRVTTGVGAEYIAGILSGADVVINLAGAPIVGRWSQAYKKQLFDSRILTTRKIVEAIGMLDKRPGLLISASAIGIYSPDGKHTESKNNLADDFLGELCCAWELEAKKAVPFTRVAITRFGIVLGKGGGALARMLPLFKAGLGGKIATGRQGFSWIHITDLIMAMQFIIDNTPLSGEFNFTASDVADNRKFTRVLAKVVNRPAFFSVPSLALKLVFGEGSVAVSGGQFVYPEHLLNAGYLFRYPTLEGALDEICTS